MNKQADEKRKTKAKERRLFPDDRRIHWGVPIAALVSGATAYALSRFIATGSPAAKTLLDIWPGQGISRRLSLLTGMAPFSLADVLIIAYTLWLLSLAAGAIWSLLRGRRRKRNALAGGARRALRDAGLIVALFYVLWGWNYSRPGFVETSDWPEWTDPEVEELFNLAGAATNAANRAYMELHGSEDVGRPTTLADDTLDVNAAMHQGWVRATEHLSLDSSFAAMHGRVKWPYGSYVLQKLGIRGIYFPFTAEANVLRGMPAVGAVTSMGHEQAHQRGITGEAEAGFLGYVAAALAPGRATRYSAAVYAMGRMGGALAAADGERWRKIAETRLPGVRRDLDDLRVFLSRTNRVASRVQSAVNDTYLKANRVPGGRANYGLATRLLISYARQHGGAVLPVR